MNKWEIKFILKNGVTVTGIYEGKEGNLLAVSNMLLSNKAAFATVRGEKKARLLSVRMDDISALEISLLQE